MIDKRLPDILTLFTTVYVVSFSRNLFSKTVNGLGAVGTEELNLDLIFIEFES